MSTGRSKKAPVKRELMAGGGKFEIEIHGNVAKVSSTLHYQNLGEYQEAAGYEVTYQGRDPQADLLEVDEEADQRAEWHQYEGAIDAIESTILAMTQAGIDVTQHPYPTVFETVMDALEFNT